MNGAVTRVLKVQAAVLHIPGVSHAGLTACYTKTGQSWRMGTDKQTASTRPRSELRKWTSEVGRLSDSTWHACQVVIQSKHYTVVFSVLKILSKKENVINLTSIRPKCHIWMPAQLPTVTSITTIWNQMVWDNYRKLMMLFDVLAAAHCGGNDFKDKYSLFFAEALVDCTKWERGRPSFTHWCLDL